MKLICALSATLLAAPATAADPAAPAKMFGAREAVQDMRLSPNGENILFLKPLPGGHAAVSVVNIATSEAHNIARDADGNSHLRSCAWKTDTRLICRQSGVVKSEAGLLNYSRMAAVDIDGNNGKELGGRPTNYSFGFNAYSGGVMNYLPDNPTEILMGVPILPTGSADIITSKKAGLSVQLVNVNTGAMRTVEQARPNTYSFGADLQGRARLMGSIEVSPSGYPTSKVHYFIRSKDFGPWQPLIDSDLASPLTNELEGFDESGDWYYVLIPTDGRQALYAIATDGSGQRRLIFSRPDVDVGDIRRVGKYRRPISAEFVTAKRHYAFLDPASAKLSEQLAKALPNHPEVELVDESWDGSKKLIFAGSDTDPGRYYLYDTANRHLGELLPARPQLTGLKLATVQNVNYPAQDGTVIPAYLTLPPSGVTKGLPAIILPHGGPSSRDVWGFDWLPQYFAQLGYAVLQPQFRGSAGFGDAWFKDNGFKAWSTAIGDINDGAHWLVKQGIAAGSKLAILGWSYGGYAALQANVVDPDLYKATIAIAPVTDLQQLKEDSRYFSNYNTTRDYIGDGPHIIAGSPARNATAIKSPILIFHGDHDNTVKLTHSRMMDAALARAGKQHQLVVYPDLDHQLNDEAARSDMLLKSAEFLAANVKP